PEPNSLNSGRYRPSCTTSEVPPNRAGSLASRVLDLGHRSVRHGDVAHGGEPVCAAEAGRRRRSFGELVEWPALQNGARVAGGARSLRRMSLLTPYPESSGHRRSPARRQREATARRRESGARTRAEQDLRSWLRDHPYDFDRAPRAFSRSGGAALARAWARRCGSLQ